MRTNVLGQRRHVISSYHTLSEHENIVSDPKKWYWAVLHYMPIKMMLTNFSPLVAKEKMRNSPAIFKINMAAFQ
jgi:hypothetical protein